MTPRHILRAFKPQPALKPFQSRIQPPWTCTHCLRRQQQQRFAHSPADDPNFTSVVDGPAKLVRTGRKHGFGIIILALIPITAFCLGTWQVQRLSWKTDLLARLEDRLVRPPLPLPPRIDPSAISAFDYRRVYTRGTFRHDQEMLVGPRIHDGHDGYLVITPLERPEGGSKVLVNRGWISKEKAAQGSRQGGDALPRGEVEISGLLREPWKKNMFTPVNRPERGDFFFPDVGQMAEVSGSEAVWVEETMEPDLLKAMDRETRGVPIGRPAEVNIRNNHLQYIFTW
ncbi:MAG: surf-like protein [Bogoriella megaspora]|nr:MAG: surf-like protein [Bogoriella megaspora]